MNTNNSFLAALEREQDRSWEEKHRREDEIAMVVIIVIGLAVMSSIVLTIRRFGFRSVIRYLSFSGLLGLSVATLLASPFETTAIQIAHRSPVQVFNTVWEPIWDPPESVGQSARLRIEIMAIEWLSIVGLGIGVHYVTRKTIH